MEGSAFNLEKYLTIGLKTFLVYLVILILFRLMGKREVGELSILDLVVSIMIGDIAVLSLENSDKPFFEVLFPMFLLALIQFILAFISLKSVKFRNLMDGKPQIIINQGRVDEKAMRKQRYNFDDLLTQLREQGVDDLGDVEFAILESSGKLSVLKNTKHKKNLGKATPFPLIIDGEIQAANLEQIGKGKEWLMHQLVKRGISDMKYISICGYKDGSLYIDINEEKK